MAAMSSTNDSRTPHDPPPQPSNPSITRSFTLPARIRTRPAASAASSDSTDGIETLFTHTNTKIVSFTAATPSRPSPTSRRSTIGSSLDTPGSIPWRSYPERTLAVGVLRIYRVTSSNVSFLNSGSLLHTIFPKSQCWCVDSESKFVLRIRQDSYYRIELPFDSEEDKQKVEDFKLVLAQVLQYEKTQSPFMKALEAEVPDRPKTPPRRRPRKPAGKAKKWLFDKTWVPEDGPRPSTPVLEGSDSGTASSCEDDDTDANDDDPVSPATLVDTTPAKQNLVLSVSERAKLFQGTRSATGPAGTIRRPVALLQKSPSMSTKSKYAQLRTRNNEESPQSTPDTASLMSSAESFYSLDTAQPSPSPPYMDAETGQMNPWANERSFNNKQKPEEETRGRVRHRRHVSEATLRAPSAEYSAEPVDVQPVTTPTIDVRLASPPSTPPLISDSEEDSLELPSLDAPTPPNTLRLKRLTGATQRRAFSPMPHPQNIIWAPVYNRRKDFTNALVRKTCEIILGPPAHLVQLMLRIAAKISNGAFGFNTYRVRNTSDKIPCSWESSDEDEWTEDDYGIPLSNLGDSTLRRKGWSAEVD